MIHIDIYIYNYGGTVKTHLKQGKYSLNIVEPYEIVRSQAPLQNNNISILVKNAHNFNNSCQTVITIWACIVYEIARKHMNVGQIFKYIQRHKLIFSQTNNRIDIVIDKHFFLFGKLTPSADLNQ